MRREPAGMWALIAVMALLLADVIVVVVLGETGRL